jgi:hypothetical protein
MIPYGSLSAAFQQQFRAEIAGKGGGHLNVAERKRMALGLQSAPFIGTLLVEA